MAAKINYMSETIGIDILKKYNIEYPDYGIATDFLEAQLVAENIGYPVVMKVISSDIPHKSEAGGIITNLTGSKDIYEAWFKIDESIKAYNINAHIEGYLICKQINTSIEFIIGAVNDDIFGPTIMFGLGGIYVEIINDVAFGICPVNSSNLKNMIKDIRGYPLLQGKRGQKPVNLDLLIDLMMKLSKVIMDRTDITEIDLNPVRIDNNKAVVLDVKIFTRA